MTDYITQEQKLNNKKRKLTWNNISAVCLVLFETGILLFLLLIYWEAIQLNIIAPYRYFLIGIGICTFGIAVFILIKQIKNDFPLFENPFSVSRVKQDRIIREIMVLRNAGQNFEWKVKESVRNDFNSALREAEDLAHNFKFEKSWGCVLNAETLLVNSIDTSDVEHLATRAKLILIESKKVKSDWREKQIETLLGTDSDNSHFKITKDNLLKAMTIRNDYYLTRSHKINLHTVNANILTLVMILIVGGIFFFSFHWNLGTLIVDENHAENFPKGILVAAIFGALGAGFSYGKTLFSYNPESSKIPEQLLSMAVTAFRFIIGASAAIIILMLFESKFLGATFSDEVLKSPTTYIVFSFIAGFSERWVVKMLGLVTKEKEKE